MATDARLLQINIEDEMRTAFLDYAMSVIIARALPDVRDGLKPVHRRALLTLYDLNLTPDRGYRKCAKICGDISGNYHPHGEGVVYPSVVRLAQRFAMRYPLVDGQGNYGSVDGDPPAAMRYTEARMTEICQEMLRDLEKETVDFIPNYDGTREEPVVLPSTIPNLLMNGSAGIAVGMATNIPPHNLGEVVDGLVAMLADPHISVDELMQLHSRSRFPDRWADLWHRGHSRCLPDRARPHHHAGTSAHRAIEAHQPRADHHQRDPLSGEQSQARRENR